VNSPVPVFTPSPLRLGPYFPGTLFFSFRFFCPRLPASLILLFAGFLVLSFSRVAGLFNPPFSVLPVGFRSVPRLDRKTLCELVSVGGGSGFNEGPPRSSPPVAALELPLSCNENDFEGDAMQPTFPFVGFSQAPLHCGLISSTFFFFHLWTSPEKIKRHSKEENSYLPQLNSPKPLQSVIREDFPFSPLSFAGRILPGVMRLRSPFLSVKLSFERLSPSAASPFSLLFSQPCSSLFSHFPAALLDF